MKLKRVLVWIIIIIFSVISLSFTVGYFFVETVPTTLFATCLLVDDTPPRPEHTYGEFPFSLTYKVNGETTTIKNTYVCVFEGVGWDTGRGFYRKWNGYVKETGLENVLIVEDSKMKVFCQVGDPQFYMGDDKDLSWENKSLSPPHIYLIKKSNNYAYISVEEIKQTYGIESMSWEFSEPIKNSFKK